MIASLNAEGMMGVVMPHGVLFRGSSEKAIRQGILNDDLLEAVVGLPAALFYGTGIPAAVLVFRKDRTDNNVLFIDASREFTPGKKQNLLEDAHIEKIVRTYRERAEVERYSHRAVREEIAENGYNLNIPRYVDTFEPEEEIDVAAVQKDILRIEAELAEVRAKMAGYLRELGVDA